MDQKTVMQRMLEDGVSTRRGVMNAHRERAGANITARGLERSELSQDRGVILPLLPGMRTESVQDVVVSLRAALTAARDSSTLDTDRLAPAR
jgi:dTDP-4-amino-4,6-dideoxygalactose transaminase